MADSSCRDLSDDIKTPLVSRRPTYITHLPANARSCHDLSDDKWTTIEDQTRSNHRCIGLALISFKRK